VLCRSRGKKAEGASNDMSNAIMPPPLLTGRPINSNKCSFNIFWQLIPDAWFGDGEGMFTELQSRPSGNKIIVAGTGV